MANVFANVALRCVWYLECSAHFARDVRAFCILCVQFLDLCVKFEKEAKFWKSKQFKKTTNYCQALHNNTKQEQIITQLYRNIIFIAFNYL